MANINLLPWRAERRRQRERDFYLMLAAAAVSAVLAWLVWGWWMDRRIDDQEGRNGYLHSEDPALVAEAVAAAAAVGIVLRRLAPTVAITMTEVEDLHQVLTDAGVNLEQSRAETLRLLGSDMPQTSASGSTAPISSFSRPAPASASARSMSRGSG